MDYKYYLALTSQLPFCSVPLRIDTYSNCQFSCSYCFSKARGGAPLTKSNQEIAPAQLEKRLSQVSQGRISGAVDEFLARRIPVQLGGMNDPFSPWEKEGRKTLETLKILRDYQYPTLISTKNTMLAEEPYLEVLATGNFLVRISITAGYSESRAALEKGVPSWEDRLRAAGALSSMGIPVSFRFQPIIFGEEDAVTGMIRLASTSGVRHISAEYLKLPIEKTSRQITYLSRSFPHMIDTYRKLNARQVGRELVLPSPIKAPGLFQLREEAISQKMVFGFAENEFLHLNSFHSCCNAADKFLKDANFFSSNILGILKRQMAADEIRFDLPDSSWVPTFSVFSHLNSRSRGSANYAARHSPRERWVKLLQDKWNSETERGGPSNFWGISDLGKVDSDGNKTFSVDRNIIRHDAMLHDIS
ncbi:radical SAM protein [uncultured Maritalea sp.]|jgi:DNA repair photolyase|uniref:SPL family radical SAM protein n=1 Tax=uncultured Maritalea sp. TaxID=757249 RepID=UPI0026229F38|nr:radical SAM protein [uncultured Maritalea sp.]